MTTVQVIWATAAREEHLAVLHEEGQDPVTERTVETDILDGMTDEQICEILFRDTNLYEGAAWDILQPLPETRTHTALSVGDYVVVDGRMYRCATVGWKRTDTFIPGLGFMEPAKGDED